MPFRPGELFGDYEILRLLGAGGMGEVYQVRNTLSDRTEAIKVLSSGLQANPDLQERFLREIKISASLRHPHIAELRTAQRVDGLLIMVMEFVDGVTVDALVKRGPLPAKNALHYTGQVLDALAFAHERGVVHRDIKPQNIMVTAGNEVRLMDFGIARSLLDQGMTMTGMTLGSLYYMSPEQIRGEPTNHRTDIYSLGIALYEMCTGSKPFEGNSGYTVMAAHLDQPPPPPVERNPNLPDALNDLILKAIEKRPQDRYADAGSFLQAVLRLQGSLPGAVQASVVDGALAARDEQLASGALITARLGTPTQTMPATPLPSGARAPSATASQASPVRIWLAAGAMLIVMLALVLLFGPRYWQPDESAQSRRDSNSTEERRAGSRNRTERFPPRPSDAPDSASGLSILAGREGAGDPRRASRSDAELRQAMEEADAALKQAGILVSLYGPEAREGRRFVALERADAMLAIAKRYQAVQSKREALTLRRREIPRLLQPLSQTERQSAMGAMGERWRELSDSLAAAEAAIKSQNLRLAGEELSVAEAAAGEVDKGLTHLEHLHSQRQPAAN